MQPIFRLLDPHHIQVRARINESQVARIRPGLPVLIHLEAFPEHRSRVAWRRSSRFHRLPVELLRMCAAFSRRFASNQAHSMR